MKPTSRIVLAMLLAAAIAGPMAAQAEVAIGSLAPDFTLQDVQGVTHRLSDFSGRVVVLEWINTDCPFVKKHYGPGNMQDLQKTYTDRDVVWLSICSSAPDKQGYFRREEWAQILAENGSQATAVLLDADGTVGMAYSAKTTPHMFVIDAAGVLAYDGAIDDKPSTQPDDIPLARPLLAEALDAVLAGEPVATPKTTPYGCSVKY